VGLILAGMLLSGIALGEESSKASKNLVLVYMVGSDLESEGGAATQNLLQMVNATENRASEDLQVIVAYGGANKPGWEGLRIATIEDIKEDSADEEIGNEEYYLIEDPAMDIATPETLGYALGYATSHYSADTTYLIFWDHGMAYDGFGQNEITEKTLSLIDLKDGLLASNTTWDLIGFDACLMASLEVAETLAPYGRYLVASEELEPGDGWDYSGWLSSLAMHPDSDPTEIGKAMVDGYVTQSGEDESAKTLSVMDLSQIPDLAALVSDFSENELSESAVATNLAWFGRALSVSPKFGITPGTDEADVSLDLGAFVRLAGEQIPGISEEVQNIGQKVRQVVIYEKHNSLVPDVSGISIRSPSSLQTAEGEGDESDESGLELMSNPWNQFLYYFVTEANNNLESPELTQVTNQAYTISDPNGTALVYANYYLEENGSYIQIGSSEPLVSDDGVYEVPDWDGMWVYLADATDPENYALLEFIYDQTLPDGRIQYTSEIDIESDGTAKTAVLYTTLNPDTGAVIMQVTPYTAASDGSVIFSRTSTGLKPGDTITTYGTRYFDESDESEWVSLGSIVVTPDTDLVYDTLPDGVYSLNLNAELPFGKETFTDLRFYTIEDGKVV